MKERRSDSDGEAILAEALARLRAPGRVFAIIDRRLFPRR